MKSLIRWLKPLWLPMLAFALAVPGAAPAQTVIRIAVPDTSAGPKPAGGGIVDVIYANKLLDKAFAKQGVELRWTFFKGAGPAINEAFANGQVDLAFLGDLAAVIGRANGLDTRLIAALARNVNGFLAVTPGSGIADLRALKGKQVAVFRGTALQLSFDSVLRAEGLAERDLRVVNLDPNAAAAALAARRIDAVWGAASVFVLRDKGLADVPVSTKGRRGVGTLKAGLVASSAFLRAHPELARTVVKTVVEASQWLSDKRNFDAFIALESQQGNIAPSIWRNELTADDLSVVFSPLLDRYYVDAFKQDVRTAKEAGLIRRPFDVDAWIDRSYVEAALRELNLGAHWQAYESFGKPGNAL
ncbi:MULTISPECIES: ABC transporter substrate-binding protein [Burkholderia]|uniref:ABC transporter substrate-binding protein n=1 Tax=Burkholderia TaxID=32008 RepID=UPI00084182F1|nr:MULTISPECIES: ABC transporter substrate-binding protein [unclassified Burkholderia]